MHPTSCSHAPWFLAPIPPLLDTEQKSKNVPVLWEALAAVPRGVFVVPCTPRAGPGDILRGSSSCQRCWSASLPVVAMAAALPSAVAFLLWMMLLAGGSRREGRRGHGAVVRTDSGALLCQFGGFLLDPRLAVRQSMRKSTAGERHQI